MNNQKPSPDFKKPSTENTATDGKEKANKLNEQNEEFGGQEGPDPTRYGDWEKGGRCTDF